MLALLQGHYLVMAPKAKQAWEYFEKAVFIDPLYYDTYMSVGAYQYFIGSLPEAARFVAQAIHTSYGNR